MAEIAEEPQVIDPLSVYIGRRLKRCRKSQDLSLADVAKSVDITYQQLQKYETGRNRISAPRLYKLSKILEADVSWFFEGYQEPTPKEYPLPRQNIPTQQEIDELLEHFHSILTPELRSVVIGTAELHKKTQKF